MSTDDRAGRAHQIFSAALDEPADRRAALLDRLCAGDAELREWVESLLRTEGTEHDLLDSGVPELSALLVDDADQTGRLLGSYRILSEIGRGGMGTVYLAERADGEYELIAAEGDDADATRTALDAFTPRYSSPEQIRRGPITPSTDVYALGVILYELIAGALPFPETGDPFEAARARLEDDPPPPSAVAPPELRRRIRGDLDAIVLRALRRGRVLQMKGELDEAEAHLRAALEIDRRAYGPDHPEVAADSYQLGMVLAERGDCAAAAPYFEQAIAIFDANGRADQLETARTALEGCAIR